jgi:hypothetical protein
MRNSLRCSFLYADGKQCASKAEVDSANCYANTHLSHLPQRNRIERSSHTRVATFTYLTIRYLNQSHRSVPCHATSWRRRLPFSKHITSSWHCLWNVRLIMKCKICCREGSWPKLRKYSVIFLEESSKETLVSGAKFLTRFPLTWSRSAKCRLQQSIAW